MRNSSILSVGLVLLVSLMTLGCGAATPDAGHEAVLIKKPYIFGDGGVHPEPVRTGRTYIALTTDAVYVDVRPIQFMMAIDDMFSKDNVPLDFNAALRVRVTNSVRLVKEFGVDQIAVAPDQILPSWYVNNIFKPWERAIRRAVKSYGMSEMVSDAVHEVGGKSTIEQIDDQVEAEMRAEFGRINLPVNLIDITIGRANPPDEIKGQRVETARQEQLQKTEEQRQLAEVKRGLAERERAKSDNAYRNEMGLNTEQFVALEAIKVQREVCGNGNCSFIIGAGEITPVLNVGK